MRSGRTSRNICFGVKKIEQIKGISRGKDKPGMLGFLNRLRIPMIANTTHRRLSTASLLRLSPLTFDREQNRIQSLEEAMASYPDAYAALVRRREVLFHYLTALDLRRKNTG